MSSSLLSILSSPLTWIVGIYGLFMGSFFNVCVFRIPEGSFFSKVRSVCRLCQEKIPFFHNIPLFSFLFLRGRAACCQGKISWIYPFVEVGTAFLFVFIYWHFPFVEIYNDQWNIDPLNLIRFIHALILSSVLLICSVIDLRLMIIPDVLSIPMIILSPLVAYLHPELKLLDSLIGVVLGGGVLYTIAWIYWFFRREVGMGFGDVKLLAGIGGWLGYQSIFPTIFYASILGTLVGFLLMLIKRQLSLKLAIPFGPFLSVGAVGFLLYGSRGLYLF